MKRCSECGKISFRLDDNGMCKKCISYYLKSGQNILAKIIENEQYAESDSETIESRNIKLSLTKEDFKNLMEGKEGKVLLLYSSDEIQKIKDNLKRLEEKINYDKKQADLKAKAAAQTIIQKIASKEPIKIITEVPAKAKADLEEYYPIDTYTKVAGVTFENDNGVSIQKILPTLRSGRDLVFIREPENTYDENAIKVMCGNQHIGYIRAELAEEIAPIMDSGKELKGYITQITGGTNGKTYGCNIHISI